MSPLSTPPRYIKFPSCMRSLRSLWILEGTPRTAPNMESLSYTKAESWADSAATPTICQRQRFRKCFGTVVFRASLGWVWFGVSSEWGALLFVPRSVLGLREVGSVLAWLGFFWGGLRRQSLQSFKEPASSCWDWVFSLGRG